MTKYEPLKMIRADCGTKLGVGTKLQAERLGARFMPSDLKAHGFKVSVFTATVDDNGWDGHSTCYGK